MWIRMVSFSATTAACVLQCEYMREEQKIEREWNEKAILFLAEWKQGLFDELFRPMNTHVK